MNDLNNKVRILTTGRIDDVPLSGNGKGKWESCQTEQWKHYMCCALCSITASYCFKQVKAVVFPLMTEVYGQRISSKNVVKADVFLLTTKGYSGNFHRRHVVIDLHVVIVLLAIFKLAVVSFLLEELNVVMLAVELSFVCNVV
ncbi:hypothetical protein Q3G72_008067 [Acer saccharum]|nr:hypothetical protein Q3G72_008067 [Acer saccharum]